MGRGAGSDHDAESIADRRRVLRHVAWSGPPTLSFHGETSDRTLFLERLLPAVAPSGNPMNSNQLSPPGGGDRLPLLDVARGVAVLGILVMNMPGFALEECRYVETIEAGGGQTVIPWLQELVFNGRMRAIFSMLFGAGTWLALSRGPAVPSSGSGRDWNAAERHTRRMVWLLVFGLVHGWVLLWPGDILYDYAICGLFLPAFVRMGAMRAAVLGAVFLAIPSAVGAFESLQEASAWRRSEAVLAAHASGETLDADTLAAARAKRAEVTAWRTADPERIAALRGSYSEAFVAQGEGTYEGQTEGLYRHAFFDALGAMLIGIALAASGFFHGRWPRQRSLALLAVGYGVALPISVWITYDWFAAGASVEAWGNDLAYRATIQPIRVLVGLAHMTVIACLVKRGAMPVAQRVLGAVGRLALTHYVTQTVVCAVILFGPVCGLYDRLSLVEVSAIVVAIWAAQIAVSGPWLRRFRQGPLEWLWRSLVAGAWLPNRR